MARSNTVRRLATLALLALLPGAGASPRPSQEPPAGGAREATPASPVERVKLLKRGGGRLDWSVQGDQLAFDQRGGDGLYDLYVMAPDGGGQRCLTCDHPELRKAHAFNPVWHPSGQVLAFLVQDRGDKLDLSTAALTSPDRGLRCELWVISRDGRRLWRLTRSVGRGGALLDPAFSHEGDRLAWSERVGSRGGRWGEWVVRVGRFRLRAGVPRLSDVETYKPGEDRHLLVVSDFAPDDRHLLLAGEVGTRPVDGALDLYRMSLEGGRLEPLLETPDEWDEQIRASPGGSYLVWTSSRGLPAAPRLGQLGESPTARPVPRELWMMAQDGGDPRRLTSFNRSDGPGNGRGAVVSDFAWRPDGGALAVHVITDLATGEEAIYLLELADGFGR